MDISLIKTDQVCGNAFLVDEKLCLSDSFDILNYNFNSLSAAIDQLTVYSNQMNNLYNLFTANSGSWNTGAVNTNENSAFYDSMYVNLTQLSATYNKEFAVFYPYMIEIQDWYDNVSDYENDINDWLDLNFATNDFAHNQFINVYVNLYQVDTFTFSFSGQYNERCIVKAPPVQVCCSGGSCPAKNQGCNYKVGRQRRCGNAYDVCGQYYVNNCGYGGCPSLNARLLQLYNVSAAFNDNYTARCLYLKFKKVEENAERWTLV
jgi:hypothetical protein